MNYFEEYDKTNPLSIENYAQKLIGKTFQDVIDADEQKQPMLVRETSSYGVAEVSEVKRNKGNLGQIIEERFFHYACNNDVRPDFHEAVFLSGPGVTRMDFGNRLITTI